MQADEPEDWSAAQRRIYTRCFHSIKLVGCGRTGRQYLDLLLSGKDISSNGDRENGRGPSTLLHADDIDLIWLEDANDDHVRGVAYYTDTRHHPFARLSAAFRPHDRSDGEGPDQSLERIALGSAAAVHAALSSAQSVFFITSLGEDFKGRTAPWLAQTVQELGILSFSIAILLTYIKGHRRVRAYNELKALIPTVDAIIAHQTDHYRPSEITRIINAISETIFRSGLVNLDIADLKAIVTGGGVALFGFGEAVPDELGDTDTGEDDEHEVVWTRTQGGYELERSVATTEDQNAPHERPTQQAQTSSVRPPVSTTTHDRRRSLDHSPAPSQPTTDPLDHAPKPWDQPVPSQVVDYAETVAGRTRTGTMARDAERDLAPAATASAATEAPIEPGSERLTDPEHEGEAGPEPDPDPEGTTSASETEKDQAADWYYHEKYGLVFGGIEFEDGDDETIDLTPQLSRERLLDDADPRHRAVRIAVETALDEVAAVIPPRFSSGVLVNVIGDESLSLAEAEHVAWVIRNSAHRDLRLIWGATIDNTIGNRVQVFILMGVPWRYVFYD